MSDEKELTGMDLFLAVNTRLLEAIKYRAECAVGDDVDNQDAKAVLLLCQAHEVLNR